MDFSMLTPEMGLDDFEREIRAIIGKTKDKIKLKKLQIEVEEYLKSANFAKNRLQFAKTIFSVKSNKLNKKESPVENVYTKEKLEKGEDIPGTLQPHRGFNLSELKSRIAEIFLISDTDSIDTVLALAKAHELKETPVWMWMIAPPSSGKTEHVDLLKQHPRVHTISSLTPKTLFSGLDKEETHDGEPAALMAKLTDNILTFKDMTTVLNLRKDDRDIIFADLREIFDGEYAKDVGTGQRILWTGHISLLAGVTAVIDRYHSVMGEMGPRFLSFRLQLPNEKEAMALGRKRPKGEEWKKIKRELYDDVWRFLRDLPLIKPEFDEYAFEMVENIALLVARSRSRAYFNNDGELEEIPEPEMAMRINEQLQTLAKGYAIIRESAKVEKIDLLKVLRVGLDTLPPGRGLIIRKLWEKECRTNQSILDGTHYSEELLHRNTDALKGLGVIQSKGGVGQSGHQWEFTPEFRQIIDTLRTIQVNSNQINNLRSVDNPTQI